MNRDDIIRTLKKLKEQGKRHFERLWHMRAGERDIPVGRIITVVLVVIVLSNLGLRIWHHAGPEGTAGRTTTEREIEYWSCSMHPQIKLPDPGLCPICAMDLIPVYTDAPDRDLGEVSLTLGRTARRLAEVETAPARYEPVFNEIRLVGKIDYDETRVARISAWVGGRIDRLYADFTGIEIEKGAPMIEIYSPELISAQEEYIQALENWEKLRDRENILPLSRRSAEEAVASSEKKLELLGVGKNQIQEIAEKRSWREHLIIEAPISGTVIHKAGFAGKYVRTGEHIYTVADLGHVWLYLEAYESDIQWLRYGQEASVEVEAYPGETFHGKVSFIDPVVNERTRTVGVRVDVPNDEAKLKPGMFARVLIRTPFREGEPVLVIPDSAPLITGRRAVVYVEKPHTDDLSLYEGREVRLGPRAQDKYVVYSGLNEGENVVVKGNFKIDSAMQIMARPSMMSPLGYYTEAEEDSVLMKWPVHVSEDAGILAASFHHYLEAARHLADDDPDPAARQLEHFREGLLSALAKYEPIRGEGLVPDIQRMIQQAGRAGETLPSLREALRDISLELKGILREHEYNEEPRMHLIFCPMAFDDEGAYWFQEGDDIANPYFGPAMLRCGEVEEIFGRREVEERRPAPVGHDHH